MASAVNATTKTTGYIVEDFNEKGIQSYEAGKYEEAIEYFDRAILKNPKHPLYFISRGNAYFKLKKWEEAINNYKTASILKPHSEVIHASLAECYSELKELDLAQENCCLAISQNPANWENHALLSGIYIQKGDIQEARKAYTKAVIFKGTDREAEEALKDIKQVLDCYQGKHLSI